MDANNPYETPQDLSRPEPPRFEPLTLSVALLFVLKTAGIFAAIGTLLGVLLGLGLPQYYRQVFDAIGDPSFSPPVAGLMLGFMQGGLLGVFAGLVMLAIVTWSRSRARQR